MALTYSNQLKLGKKAPNFYLRNSIDGKKYNLNELKGIKGTAIFFICNHCPYVIHINEELVMLANDYKNKGINCIAISSNDIDKYPQDSPELMRKIANKLNYPFAYLYDETQEVAKAYNATCTPDLFLFDADLKAVYQGRLDDSSPGNGKEVSGKDFRNAIEALLIGDVVEKQLPSMGCNIKWK